VSYHISTNSTWDPTQLFPITWSYLNVNGQPAIAIVRSICSTIGATEETVTLTGLNTSRIDFTCDAVRGPSNKELIATISGVKAMSPVWRFRNLVNGSYLWSADSAERADINTKLWRTWREEGVAYQINLANGENASPLWRFRNLKTGFFLYSSDPTERADIKARLKSTWVEEGEAYKISRTAVAGGKTVWRFRNRGNGTYLYSADPAERANIKAFLSSTWLEEGEAYYLAP